MSRVWLGYKDFKDESQNEYACAKKKDGRSIWLDPSVANCLWWCKKKNKIIIETLQKTVNDFSNG